MTQIARQHKQAWKIGDVFSVELADRSLGLGQIVGREPQVLNSASVALFESKLDEHRSFIASDCSRDRVIACLFTTRDLLDSGVWRVFAAEGPALSGGDLPYEGARATGFVGARVIGSGIVRRFMNAFFGLEPWDQMKDSSYFDKLLIDPKLRPTQLIYKADRGSEL